MTPEAAYAEVERLVKKFKSLSAAERRHYNEAATRQGFILPLFHALGWDTANPAEVSPEEKVSRRLDNRCHALATTPSNGALRRLTGRLIAECTSFTG